MFTKVTIFSIAVKICFCKWNYDDQDLWPIVYCQGSITQSPVDITRKVAMNFKSPSDFQLNGWDKVVEATATNTGRTILLEIPPGVTISGGTLPGTYNVTKFNFHWGAEHTIEGVRHDLETHFITFNEKFKSESDAKEYVYGTAIFGVISTVGDVANSAFGPIIERMDILKKPGTSVSIPLKLRPFLPNALFPVYRYVGSYTTPNCHDGVIWLVMANLNVIGREQYDAITSIEDENGKLLPRTYRHQRNIEGRTIFKLIF